MHKCKQGRPLQVSNNRWKQDASWKKLWGVKKLTGEFLVANYWFKPSRNVENMLPRDAF